MKSNRFLNVSEYTRLQAEVIAKVNAQKNDFRASFNEIALAMGFKVIDADDAEAMALYAKEKSGEVKNER